MIQINEQNNKEEVLKSYINRFSQAKVLVIGDIIMDEYFWGNVTRISPEAPVPIVEVTKETRTLGGAANVIHNLATLGSNSIICGIIGEDLPGYEIQNMVEKIGMTTNGIIKEPDRPTSIKTRVVAQSQQVVRFDRESRQDINASSINDLLDFIGQKLNEIDAIVVSDYGKGVISSTMMKELRSLVSNSDIIIAVDPKIGNFKYYHDVHIITPNHHEASSFCGFEITDRDSLMKAGKKMLYELKCRSVLITQGKDGMTLFENSGEIFHIPTIAKKVYDVTGAGDTVIATIALGLATGLGLKSSAVLSNLAAGIVVGEVGTTTISTENLLKVIDQL